MQYPNIIFLDDNNRGFIVNSNTTELALNNYLWHFEEKIDGSQLSFSIAIDGVNRSLVFTNKRKKAKETNFFKKTMESLNTLLSVFNPQYVYHGEAIVKNKPNVIEYQRIPPYHFVCYDIYDLDSKKYLILDERNKECLRLGLESVQVIYKNNNPKLNPYEKAQEILNQICSNEIQSQLGGKIEGLVLKHPNLYSHKNTYVATKRKIVTPDFKENHLNPKFIKSPNSENLSLENFGEKFNTYARFHKAKQHLQEEDKWCTDNNANLNNLQIELNDDFDKEYQDIVKEYLYQTYGKIIKNAAQKSLDKWFNEINK